MSVEGVIGSEMFEQTKPSAIRKILARIEEAVRGKQEQQVVEVCFPDGELEKLSVHEAIHIYYSAEIINSDRLFIKEQVHLDLAFSLRTHNRNWFVSNNAICVVGGNELRPDVGVWFQWPTYAERSKPLMNSCPPSHLWIKVFYNNDPDRSNALEKVALIQQYWNGIEYVGITLPVSDNPFRPNPNPGTVTTPATNNQNTRPYRDPYIIHWDANNNKDYYVADWNLNLVLNCSFTLEFNIILDIISRP
ncbi:6583_t:CDS:2 [Acaulospora morrowiae]|uniref:6583_t:CDS:1 n=1 Tax=Acaulospora morrowiae TaxID=94023 RepID=A0A9N9GZZ5_9GLOM|nr:6583_t:CDS:2 [Acaulospora morrowiae]